MNLKSPDELLDLFEQTGLTESELSIDDFLATSHGYLARDGASASRWDQSRNAVLNGLNRIRASEAGQAALRILLTNDIRESRDHSDRSALLDFVSWRAKVVESVPTCDYCSSRSAFEGRTKPAGNWAFMCEAHFRKYGNGLGENSGQKLIVRGSLRDGYDGPPSGSRSRTSVHESPLRGHSFDIADALIDAEASGALNEFTVGGHPLIGTDFTGYSGIQDKIDKTRFGTVAGSGYADPTGRPGQDGNLETGVAVRYESLNALKSRVSTAMEDLHFLVVSTPMSEEKAALADLHMELVRALDDLSNFVRVAESSPDDVRLEAAEKHFRKMYAEMVDALSFEDYHPGNWTVQNGLSELR